MSISVSAIMQWSPAQLCALSVKTQQERANTQQGFWPEHRTQWNGRAHLCSLLNDAVPHLVGQQHVLLYQVLLHTLVCLCPNHVSNCFIKCVHLRGQPHHKQQGQKGLRESSALPDMFELCTGSHQPWSIFFQVPDALCLKFLCIHCAGGHCSFLESTEFCIFPFWIVPHSPLPKYKSCRYELLEQDIDLSQSTITKPHTVSSWRHSRNQNSN